MGPRIVVALGGNALGSTPEQQLALVKSTAKTIVDLVAQGYEVVIGHGNGPQVGMIHLAMEYSASRGGGTPGMPYPECGAMTQGYIGYHLQQAVQGELARRGIERPCVTVVTQVEVDPEDPGFQNPTKPVGSFHTRAEAERIAKEQGLRFVEDAGRGYRRVVPSPIPLRIVELEAVKRLCDAGVVVITAGGGGIPVVDTPEGLRGVAAVIDKDRACALLARELKADSLLILTAVERVCLHYGRPGQQEITAMTAEEAERYMKEKQFAPGSMLPKVEACVEFVRKTGGTAYIASLSRGPEALAGNTGTRITKE